MSDEPATEGDPDEEQTVQETASSATGGTGPGEVSEEEQQRIEDERDERLDDANRPDEAEVDNTPRDFDSEVGMFTDSEGYDESEKKFDDDAV